MSELRDENDAEHYYNATVRLMAEVADLRAEVETWKQRAETAWAKGDEEAEARIRLMAEVERLRGAIAEIRAGKGRRPNPGYPDYVEAYDDWIVEVFDRWGV